MISAWVSIAAIIASATVCKGRQSEPSRLRLDADPDGISMSAEFGDDSLFEGETAYLWVSIFNHGQATQTISAFSEFGFALDHRGSVEGGPNYCPRNNEYIFVIPPEGSIHHKIPIKFIRGDRVANRFWFWMRVFHVTRDNECVGTSFPLDFSFPISIRNRRTPRSTSSK